MRDQTVLVTGGAGFIGSHLANRLLDRGNDVIIADDCSIGNAEWVPGGVTFRRCDISDPETLVSLVDADLDVLVHLAARSAVNDTNPRSQFRENTRMTEAVIAAARASHPDHVIFTSTSTVYGEAPTPTPEDYGPLLPISVYGASKLASEALLSSAAAQDDLSVTTFRLANVVGPRLRGAVIPDFIEKLRDDPSTLEILGDGRQSKSYLHISDCLTGLITLPRTAPGTHDIINLGSETTTSVDRIARIVADELGCDPRFEYAGGERGWPGDVPEMRLSIEKAKGMGWEPRLSSESAIRRATRELATELPTPAE